MTNPRKFSEKIALHSQKLAEETAAFEEIMREVGSAVTKTEPPSYSTAASPLAISPNQHTYLQPFHRGCGGSLPNVNQMSMHNQSIVGVGGGVGESLMAGLSSVDRRGGTEYDQRGSLVGPQRSPRSACEHRRETSPYSPSSVAAAAHLLTPPVECGWRRTHSDSSLHQTLQQQQAYGAAGELPANSSSPAYNCQPQLQGGAGRSPMPHVSSIRRTADMSGSGDISPVPALYPHWAYSSHQSNSSALLSSVYSGMCSLNGPVDGNSGSLPDLSSVNFPSPLAHPLDADGKMTPPYSTNRLCVPSTMISSSYLHGSRGSMMCASGSPGGSGSGAGSYSTQSPQQSRRSPRSPQHRTNPASPQPPPSPQQAPLSPESQHELLHVYRQPTVSPCPSPSLGQTGGYRSPSPFGDGPLSPAAPASPLGNGAAASAGFYSTSPQTQQLQRQFEQFSMDMYCGSSVQSTGLHSLSSGAVVCRSNPLSPGTPTKSIPEITLSDFSSATEAAALDTPELLRDLRDATDILQGGDDPFRDGDLGELDLEGLHMLTNPEGDLIDPNAEDCFRLESLAP